MEKVNVGSVTLYIFWIWAVKACKTEETAITLGSLTAQHDLHKKKV